MAQDDVGQFARKHHGEAGFVRKDVHQAAAYYDGTARAESFQRQRQHHAGVHRAWQFNVVGGQQIVDNGLQHLVHVTAGSEQASVL